MMPGDNLKSKLDGNQLDLSLSSLTTVPVKELSMIPKATYLDLSCNLLTVIEPEFCLLTHLVRIDLSKNQLTELPENFGDLQKLQHLDLYQNKLTAVPTSFCRLNALKWLDMRDNPLQDGRLLAAGGECLSDAQCRNCAKQVVAYMKKVQSDEERDRQKRLKEEREKETLRKAEEERELERKRAEKKAEKEWRRQQATKKAAEESKEMLVDERELSKKPSTVNGQTGLKLRSRRNGLSCFQIVLAVILLIVAAVCGLYVYCTGSTPQYLNDYCAVGIQLINNGTQAVYSTLNTVLTKIKASVG